MTALLATDDVAVSFGGLRALNSVSLRIQAGTIVGLIGPNGAGKTTLFNVLSGLQKPTDGRVLLGGEDITDEAVHRRTRRGIGRSFQNLGLMPEETVLRNVLAAQHADTGYSGWDMCLRPARWWRAERDLEERALAQLETFGIAARADDDVADLPFAVARFAELAAVLVRRPRVVLLDEPTTGLDVAETQHLQLVLEKLRLDGTTILLVSHDVRFTMTLCDHLYVLAEGRVLDEGPPSRIKDSEAVATVYLGLPA